MSDILEGFLCPICKQDLGTVALLTAHFDEAHTEEDRDVINQLKGLFDKAKRKLLKKDDTDVDSVFVADSFNASASGDTSQSTASAAVVWDPQELGAIKSHTDLLKRVREARIDRFVVETNKLLIRLDKLTSPDAPEDPRQRKAYEKTVVPWVLDSDVTLCPSCGKNFRITRRRHHCRLCGGIMCNQCSMFMPLSYAQKLTNPSYAYEGEGFRRSGSAGSINSIIGTDGDAHIRTCGHCRMLLERRDQQMEQRNTKQHVVVIYEKMRIYMNEADKLIPKFYEMAETLNSGETTYTLKAAQDHRFKVMKLYESIDMLSKRIATHGLDHDPPPSAKEQQLQRMIRANATNFLQQNLMGLQSLPSEEEVIKLQERRRQEIQRKIEEEKLAAAERERKRQEQEQSKLRSSGGAPTGPRGPPEGADSGEAVSKASGWKPMEVNQQQDTHDDPMIQQMNIIRGYIKQAKQVQKWDEVSMLEENLRMLQQEYWKQSNTS